MNNSTYNPETLLEDIYLPRGPACGRWEPIATAPNDGTDVLLAFPGWQKAVIGYYDIVEHYRNGKLDYSSEGWRGSWFSSFDMGLTNKKDPEPTHWMPLPTLPDAN